MISLIYGIQETKQMNEGKHKKNRLLNAEQTGGGRRGGGWGETEKGLQGALTLRSTESCRDLLNRCTARLKLM